MLVSPMINFSKHTDHYIYFSFLLLSDLDLSDGSDYLCDFRFLTATLTPR